MTPPGVDRLPLHQQAAAVLVAIEDAMAQPRGPKKTHPPRDTPKRPPTQEEIEKWYEDQGQPPKKEQPPK